MMTNQDILRIALRQSALEFCCQPEDFLKSTPTVTLSRPHPEARAYLPLPLACDIVSYGSCAVAMASEETMADVAAYLQKFPTEHLFETPNLHVLDSLMAKHGLNVCFMAEYFLPDVTVLKPLTCKYDMRLLTPAEFAPYYTETWSNALTPHRKERDVLAFGAFDGENLIGLAGCSADCETMYQLGIDVLPEYRRQGIASALTSALALEVLRLGKVPFYCAAWSNIPSVRNAIRCGFRPAWAELTARDIGFVEKMNSP